MDFTFLWLKLKLSFAWFIIFSYVSIYCNTKYKKYTSKFYNSKHLCKNSKHLFTRKEKKQHYYGTVALFNYIKLLSPMSKQDIYWNLEDYKKMLACMTIKKI